MVNIFKAHPLGKIPNFIYRVINQPSLHPKHLLVLDICQCAVDSSQMLGKKICINHVNLIFQDAMLKVWPVWVEV